MNTIQSLNVYIVAMLMVLHLGAENSMALDYSAESLLQLRLQNCEIEYDGDLHQCIAKLQSIAKARYPWVTALPVKIVPGSPTSRMNMLDFGKRPRERLVYRDVSLGEVIAAVATLNGYNLDVRENVLEFRPADGSGSHLVERIYSLDSKVWSLFKFEPDNQKEFFEKMEKLGVELQVKSINTQHRFVIFAAAKRDLDLLDQMTRLADLGVLK